MCSDHHHPIVGTLNEWVGKMCANGHSALLVYNVDSLDGGDILFLVSCSEIIKNTVRSRYKVTLVLHASDLPTGRGWSPHIWAILGGASQITVSMIEAEDYVDTGLVWLKTSFHLEGNELIDEINAKLFAAELLLMTQAVEEFSRIVPTPQNGKAGEYLRKRTMEDSRIDPNSSLSAQFNLLRVADSDRFPAFFDHCGARYLIKIEKVKHE